MLSEIITRKTNRSFVLDGEIAQEHMHQLFEAAHRAPSSWNAQPWRFWYAHSSSEMGKVLLGLMMPPNAAWAKDADWFILVGAASSMTLRGETVPNLAASFDTGAACENLTLQATSMGFGCAVIGGFDHKKAAELIKDSDIKPLVMIVVGSKKSPAQEGFSERRPLSEVVFESFS